MYKKKELYKRSKILLILGFILTILGILLSFSSLFYSSPRYKISGILEIPGQPLRIDFENGVSERIYYLLNSTSNPVNEDIDIKIAFYDKDGSYIGGKYIENLKGIAKGTVVLDGIPKYAVIEPECSHCNTTVFVTIYYSLINWNILAFLSLGGMIFSITGLISLFVGLNLFLVLKKEKERKPETKS
ncbi:MAG: hypothetical protein DRJ35_02550 [Thermoprotei archaeon]|nr:MAG: hypothetical protein DRJ35_02550 [Thermoprotei archaeon]